jgi:sugar phosphate isomerase/epimerase
MNQAAFSPAAWSRRQFLRIASVAAGAAVLSPHRVLPADLTGVWRPRIVLFGKVFQSLKLTYAEAAALTADAGLNGVDATVRPGGEVLPENAARDLPLYADALRKRSLELPLITSAITGPGSPHAEAVIRAANTAGVQYYRLGFLERKADRAGQVREVKAQLKDLAALNKEHGIGGVWQNHSPAGRTYLGGDLAELEQIVLGFDPAQIGVAFDIGHAWVVHGEKWREHFNRLKSHIRVVYVKDVTRDGRWVEFGRGDVGKLGYFGLLRPLKHLAPICLHIEFDWTEQGRSKNRGALLSALERSKALLRAWLAT